MNICVIVSDFTGNLSGLQQRQLLSKCIYLLSRKAVNVKLIHVVVSENITEFKDQVTTAVIANLALSFCSNRQVKQIKKFTEKNNGAI